MASLVLVNDEDLVVLDSDSDESSCPRQRPARGRGRGGGRGKKVTSRTRRRAACSQTSTRASSRRSASMGVEESVICPGVAERDPVLVVEEEDVTSNPEVSDKVTGSDANSVPATIPGTDCSLINNTDTRDNVDTQQTCKRTARRGLARKKTSECPDSDSVSMMTFNDTTGDINHHSSVYSQCVAKGFKTLLQIPNTIGNTGWTDSSHGNTAVQEKVKPSGADADKTNRITSEPITATGQEGASECNTSDKEDVVLTEMDSSLLIRSPTPPLQTSRPHRIRGMNKKLTSALRALSQAKVSLDERTPPRRKRRRPDSDLILLEDVEDRQDFLVKVRYLATVHRIRMKANESFQILVAKLSQELGEPEHCLALYLGDKSIQATDTPKSVHLSVADIIECHCLQASDEVSRPSDLIQLVIQCRNGKTRTTITTNKRCPLRDVMQKYAEGVGANWYSLKFSFDGEDIDPYDTAGKLAMEDSDVIDVVHTTTS